MTTRFFTYADTGYCAAAKVLREKRSHYFAVCAANPWNDSAARLALYEYEVALAIVRAEEDRVQADIKARAHGPVAHKSPSRVRFS